MSKLFAVGYITEVVILTMTSFFSVPKGTYDIRMVFYATVSGMKDSPWDPNFTLLSMVSLLIMMVPETHMADIYVGGIFYKFRLSSVLAKY